MTRLALIVWLALCGVANAQMSGGVGGFPGPGTVHSSGFTPSCTESSNWLARATGITLTADKTAYDTMICGMVTDGTFAKMDALYIFAAPDSTTAALNLIQNNFNGTTSLSFTAYQGFVGDGTNGFDSGFNPTTASSPQMTTNSRSQGVYNLTSNTTENTLVTGTWISNPNYIALQPTFGQLGCRLAGVPITVSSANSQGFIQCVRTDASTVGASKNGAAATTGAATAASMDNSSLAVFCNKQPAMSGCTTDRFSAAYFGGAMTDTDIANISSRINTFMTAYGINVY